jgi:hypothetical protein
VLASPIFSGQPTAPTASPGTSTTQLATTAFVAAAIAAAPIVSSFNSRAGAVTLTLADVTGAGGAPLASPAFTGTPTAATASAPTSSTQLATTAFVRQGSTDGSTALAGQVGEVLSNTASGNASWATSYNAATLTLPAGDWEVSGGAHTVPSGGNVSQWSVLLNISGTLAIYGFIGYGNTTGQLAATVPSYWVITTAPTVVAIVATFYGDNTGTLPTDGWVQARRMR